MSKRKANNSNSDDEFSSGTISDTESDSGTTSVDELLSSQSSDEENNRPTSPIDMPWTENGIRRPYFHFSSNAGSQVDVDTNSILSVFELFFDDNLIQLITEETNRFANQYIIINHENIAPKSRVRKWKLTNPNEIRVLLGLIVLQGICLKPNYESYFSHRECIETPFFSKVMSERRFRLLLKFLHFADNSQIENGSNRKLYKIKPVLNYLKNKFMTVYLPGRDISIDESLVGWKGHLSWKQYIPSKRKRFGIKIFMLCESSTGYVYHFLVYTGADTEFTEKYKEEPLSSRVVLDLSDSLLGKGYCLFLDNFYTSVDLIDKLLRNKTDCIGTMRLNRKGIPQEIKDKKLQKGETIARFRRKQMILKWRDKKDVVLASTIHDNSMTEIQKRGQTIRKPSVVMDYNLKMGGVDLADNILHFYSMARSHLKKFYKKLFLQLLNITVLNCYIMYKKAGGRKNRLNFTMELAENLISKYGEAKKNVQRPIKEGSMRYVERHFPAIIPPTPNKQKPTKRCVLCYENGRRKESIYWCPDCRAGLCPAPCFGKYHTNN